MKKIISLILSICMIFSMTMPSLVNAADSGSYVTICAEKFTIGLGYTKEPTRIALEDGENAAKLITRFLGEGNYKNGGSIDSGFYITGIKDDDSAVINVPKSISDNVSIGSPVADGFIGEYDYSAQAGWLMTVNNEFLMVGASDYTPKDGDVIRLQFSLCWGSDIGGGWEVNYITPANKDELTKAVAIAEDKTDANVQAAYDILENLESTDEQISTALEVLNIANTVNATASFMIANNPDPIVQSGAGEWTVMALARSGYDVPYGYNKTYYNNAVNYIKTQKGILSSTKYTEYSRVILALSSIGKDPKSIGGYNLIASLADFDKVKFQGIVGPIWALIALDSNNYEIPTIADGKIQTTRENIIDYILSLEKSGGGFSLLDANSLADVDATAMALQALSRYRGDQKIAPYIQRALSVLSNKQQQDGGFLSIDNELNVESTAQVLVALSTLGIDPKTDARFIKNGNDITSAIMKFYVSGGGFSHSLNSSVDGMATDQAMCALVAYQRFLNDKTNLYDMTDVKSVPNEPSGRGGSGHRGDGTPQQVIVPKITEIIAKDSDIDQSSNISFNAQVGAKGITAKLSGDIFEKISQGNINLTTDDVVYSLPVSSINIIDIMKNLGEEDKAKISITVEALALSDDEAKDAKENAKQIGADISVLPVKLALTAEAGYKKIKVDLKDKYALLKIKLRDNIDKTKSLSAVSKDLSAVISKVSADGQYLEIKTFGNCEIMGIYLDKNFSDLEQHWAKNEIKNLTNKLIVNGDEENKFDPERNITRAEFAAIISKALGLVPADAEIFGDVKKSDWFGRYVSSAASYGLIKGKSENEFAPYDYITREETAVILQRAATLCGIGTPIEDAEVRNLLAQFVDYLDSSNWSVNSLAFNVKNGFISERNLELRPTAEISRAEVAVMISRLLEKVEF